MIICISIFLYLVYGFTLLFSFCKFTEGNYDALAASLISREAPLIIFLWPLFLILGIIINIAEFFSDILITDEKVTKVELQNCRGCPIYNNSLENCGIGREVLLVYDEEVKDFVCAPYNDSCEGFQIVKRSIGAKE